eukprot:GHVN01098682.1.p1 GENE.GHVN01098682.1~~GHVN01098682.1.p1  ORF type:complete len:781 (+),score=145.01 GHVN01098682.1:1068-3410(+)
MSSRMAVSPTTPSAWAPLILESATLGVEGMTSTLAPSKVLKLQKTPQVPPEKIQMQTCVPTATARDQHSKPTASSPPLAFIGRDSDNLFPLERDGADGGRNRTVGVSVTDAPPLLASPRTVSMNQGCHLNRRSPHHESIEQKPTVSRTIVTGAEQTPMSVMVPSQQGTQRDNEEESALHQHHNNKVMKPHHNHQHGPFPLLRTGARGTSTAASSGSGITCERDGGVSCEGSCGGGGGNKVLFPPSHYFTLPSSSATTSSTVLPAQSYSTRDGGMEDSSTLVEPKKSSPHQPNPMAVRTNPHRWMSDVSNVNRLSDMLNGVTGGRGVNGGGVLVASDGMMKNSPPCCDRGVKSNNNSIPEPVMIFHGSSSRTPSSAQNHKAEPKSNNDMIQRSAPSVYLAPSMGKMQRQTALKTRTESSTSTPSHTSASTASHAQTFTPPFRTTVTLRNGIRSPSSPTTHTTATATPGSTHPKSTTHPSLNPGLVTYGPHRYRLPNPTSVLPKSTAILQQHRPGVRLAIDTGANSKTTKIGEERTSEAQGGGSGFSGGGIAIGYRPPPPLVSWCTVPQQHTPQGTSTSSSTSSTIVLESSIPIARTRTYNHHQYKHSSLMKAGDNNSTGSDSSHTIASAPIPSTSTTQRHPSSSAPLQQQHTQPNQTNPLKHTTIATCTVYTQSLPPSSCPPQYRHHQYHNNHQQYDFQSSPNNGQINMTSSSTNSGTGASTHQFNSHSSHISTTTRPNSSSSNRQTKTHKQQAQGKSSQQRPHQPPSNGLFQFASRLGWA